MDIFYTTIGSIVVLTFAGFLKLAFKLLDVKTELRQIKATNESILKNIIDWRIEGL